MRRRKGRRFLKKSNDDILVDTSIWIEFFKKTSSTGEAVSELLKRDRVWVSGVVLYELVQGAKSEAEKERIVSQLSALNYVEMSIPLWRRAGDISKAMKKKGLTLPISDILLATIAIEHSMSIFTLDKHFESIPGVKLYKS